MNFMLKPCSLKNQHYEPNHYENINNILPLIWDSFDILPDVDVGPGIFKDPSLLGSYQGDPPIIRPTGLA
jgi:hypothetical protein